MAKRQLTEGEKIDVYVQLREHKQAAEKEFKKSMERVNEAMAKIEADLLEAFEQRGVTSSKGKSGGTAFVKRRSNFKTVDRDAFLKYCFRHKNLELMDVRPNRTVMSELLEEGVVVDGVESSTTNVIQINKGKK